MSEIGGRISEVVGRRAIALAFAAAILCHAFVAQAAEVKLTVDASPRQIYLGDPVTLTVKVAGLLDPPPPDLAGIPDCTYALQDIKARDGSLGE